MHLFHLFLDVHINAMVSCSKMSHYYSQQHTDTALLSLSSYSYAGLVSH